MFAVPTDWGVPSTALDFSSVVGGGPVKPSPTAASQDMSKKKKPNKKKEHVSTGKSHIAMTPSRSTNGAAQQAKQQASVEHVDGTGTGGDAGLAGQDRIGRKGKKKKNKRAKKKRGGSEATAPAAAAAAPAEATAPPAAASRVQTKAKKMKPNVKPASRLDVKEAAVEVETEVAGEVGPDENRKRRRVDKQQQQQADPPATPSTAATSVLGASSSAPSAAAAAAVAGSSSKKEAEKKKKKKMGKKKQLLLQQQIAVASAAPRITPSSSFVKDLPPYDHGGGGSSKKKGGGGPRSAAARRLEGARFRMLNETLYTTTGESAFERFSADPSLFAVYHSGFNEQVQKWSVKLQHRSTYPNALEVPGWAPRPPRLENAEEEDGSKKKGGAPKGVRCINALSRRGAPLFYADVCLQIR